MRRAVALLFATALFASCSSSDEATPASTAAPTTAAETTVASTAAPTTVADTVAPETTEAAPPVDFTARPFEVFAPTSYDEATPMPLVVLLHGFGASGTIQEAYFQFQPLAEERGFLYVHPEGTINQIGRQFWNATDACCGFATTVDDSAYLLALIEQVEADYNVDPERIYLVGHSNGGFMSYRMACDHADKIAAIASLAGATYADTADCDPSEPVSVLQIHGTADDTIPYEGGSILGNEHPSAPTTAVTWAEYDGCSATPVDEAAVLDLDANLAGAETSTRTFDCPTGIGVQLWTIDGGAHIPARTPDMSTGIIDFLFAHPKP